MTETRPDKPTYNPRKKGWSPLAEILRAVWLFLYRLAGWKVSGTMPQTRKFVLIAAPHTSNWDLPIMLAVAMHYRIKLHWMGKDSLFKGPFGWAMYAMGGLPIDRSKNNDVVGQMVEHYKNRDELIIAIPPEGTRGKVREWKTGFYHIAHGAGVPIVCGFLDFPNKTGGVSFSFETTGDYEKDIAPVKEFYSTVQGKHKDQGPV